MSSNTVEEIKNRLGILELIESYIKVEKAGSSFRALCPFHNEKTPSFHISPDRNSYYCFGCGAKGDIFSFVQEFEGLDFLGALKLLAERTGVEIKYEKTDENKSEKDTLFKILEKTTIFLESQLEKSSTSDVPKAYLVDRGLTEETIKQWRLGYVPDGWDNIYAHLKKEGFKPEEIEKAGLIKKKEGGSDYYDRFRDRLMFPIFDPSGRVVGFSGRTLKQDPGTNPGQVQEAKYINSPETPLFNKSNILFGYNFAKQSIRKNNFSILVEGQFDVVLSHQAGYANAVATSGTALTEYQIDLLKRMSDRLVIAMDGDGAGFRASKRAWEMALQKGMDVKIVTMTGKEDPADIIKRNADDWRKIIKDSVHIIDFLIAKIKSEISDKRNINKEITASIIPYIHLLPSRLEQSHFVKRIGTSFGIDENIVWQEVDNFSPESVEEGVSVTKEVETEHDKFAVAKQLLGICKWQESLSKSNVNPEEIKKQVEEIIGDKNVERILSSPQIEELTFEVERMYGEDEVQKVIDELLVSLKKKIIEYKRSLLKDQLSKAEIEGDEEKQQELLQKINELSKQLEEVVTISNK